MEPADERPHPPGDDPRWAEWWYFAFTDSDGGLTGHVRLRLAPAGGVAHYWASLTGPGRLPVVVYDDEVPLPRNRSLEIRTEGLWADHIVERPFDQVTVGCEAFGLRLDSVADVHDRPMLGERVPFGLDMEWETRPADSPPTETGDDTRVEYILPCEAHGLVLVGDDEIRLEAGGERLHGWGIPRASIVPALDRAV